MKIKDIKAGGWVRHISDDAIELAKVEKFKHYKGITNGYCFYFDGQDYGHTPKNIDGLLIGNHTVEISKDGYRTEVREVEIIEDETTDCSVQLTKGYNLRSTGAGNTKAPIVYNADGTVHGLAVDGIESCAARNTKGDDLFEALMKFADSAREYLY